MHATGPTRGDVDLTVDDNTASFTESNTWGPSVLKEFVRY